jgi:hypothetical protein
VAASNVVRIAGRGAAISTTRNVVVRRAPMTAVVMTTMRTRRKKKKTSITVESTYAVSAVHHQSLHQLVNLNLILHVSTIQQAI